MKESILILLLSMAMGSCSKSSTDKNTPPDPATGGYITIWQHGIETTYTYQGDQKTCTYYQKQDSLACLFYNRPDSPYQRFALSIINFNILNVGIPVAFIGQEGPDHLYMSFLDQHIGHGLLDSVYWPIEIHSPLYNISWKNGKQIGDGALFLKFSIDSRKGHEIFGRFSADLVGRYVDVSNQRKQATWYSQIDSARYDLPFAVVN